MRKPLAALLPLALAAGCGVFGSDPKPPAVPPGVVSGGVLRIGIVEPSSVDPAQAYDRFGRLVVSAMCDALIQVDPTTGEPKGGLVKHLMGEDKGLGVTVTLKDDLAFPDGTKAQVKDVRTSLSRVASDSLASPLARQLGNVQGYALVHGDRPVEHEDDPARTTLSGVVQVTSKVLQVLPTAADAELALGLSSTWSAVTPAKINDRSDFPARPVCIGPYQLKAPWRTGDRDITLVRSEHYFARNEAFTGGGRGYPDEIRFRVYPTVAAAFAGWQRGEVDVAPVPRASLAERLRGGTISTHGTPSVEYVGLPTTRAPFDKPEVRQALSLSLDRGALLRGRPDRAAVSGLLPDTLPGGMNEAGSCRANVPDRPDLTRAAALLRQAGVSLRGVRVPLYVNDEPGSLNVETARAVLSQWQRAWGIVPQVVPLSWASYDRRARDNTGFDGPFRTSWSSDVPAPTSWLEPLFLSSSIGATNLSRFSEPFLDRGWEFAVLKEPDLEVRQRNERRIAEGLCVLLPLVPLWSGTQSYAVRHTVRSATGALQRPIDGALDVRELYVTQ